MSETPIAAAPATLDRVRHSLVGLKMPRALEALDHVVRQIDTLANAVITPPVGWGEA